MSFGGIFVFVKQKNVCKNTFSYWENVFTIEIMTNYVSKMNIAMQKGKYSINVLAAPTK